eukprot:988582-Karenia_brevis.AAC.1
MGYQDDICAAILAAVRAAIDAVGASKTRDKWKWDIKDLEGNMSVTVYVSTGFIRIACHSGRHKATIVAREVATIMRSFGAA